MAVEAKVIDFSNVKDRSGVNPKAVPAGDYHAKIVKVESGTSSKDDGFQYIFTIKLEQFSQYSYPYYCKLQENQLWKLRNLLVAAGMNVPKTRMKLDPNKVVGKSIGVTMEDDEYDGKPKSVVSAVFPASELDDSAISGSDDADDDQDDLAAVDDDDDDLDDMVADEPEPKPKAKAKAKPAPEPEPEVDDDEDEEDEDDAEDGAADEFTDMDRAKLKRFIKGKQADYSVKRSQSDDDLREVARSLAKPAKAAAATDDEDDELEELDIDDL